MNKQPLKTNYEAPQSEVIEVEVEQGYSASVNGDAFGGGSGSVVTPPMS